MHADTIGTTTACLEYRDVRISEASSIYHLGVAMLTHAVEPYERLTRG